MKFSYRISKYLYLDASGSLRSGDNEWTSFHDVRAAVADQAGAGNCIERDEALIHADLPRLHP